MRLLLTLLLLTGCTALRDGARIRSIGPASPSLARLEAETPSAGNLASDAAGMNAAVTAEATTASATAPEERSPLKPNSAPIAPRAAAAPIAPASREEPAQENLMPKKRWNRLAVPAFIAAAGTVYLGLTTTSAFVVIAAILVTLTLAGISLKRIRTHRQSGKGFAFAALMIGLFAALLTAISIGFYGVE